MDYVTLDRIIEDMQLEVVYLAKNASNVKIYSSELNRPGLPMVGYFEKFVPERIQILGSAEWHYYDELPYTLRYDSLDKFLKYPIPAIILSRNLPVFPEMLELAKKYNRSILRTDKTTSKLINNMVNHIELLLAPSTTVHGVLVEVFGMGVLITGKSGIGKSETALELVMRGHRLIADDSVDIIRVEDELKGESPKLTRHFMEIRGLGIIDIERLFGVGAVKNSEFIDLVVELELWDEKREYDRVGLDEEFIEILGLEIPKVTIPVRPGRNLAMIIEVATRNNRQKRFGYNAAIALNDRIMKEIENRRAQKERKPE